MFGDALTWGIAVFHNLPDQSGAVSNLGRLTGDDVTPGVVGHAQPGEGRAGFDSGPRLHQLFVRAFQFLILTGVLNGDGRDVRQGLQCDLIFFVEPLDLVALDVDHAQNPPFILQRHAQLRSRALVDLQIVRIVHYVSDKLRHLAANRPSGDADLAAIERPPGSDAPQKAVCRVGGVNVPAGQFIAPFIVYVNHSKYGFRPADASYAFH